MASLVHVGRQDDPMTDTIYPRQEIFVWEDLVFNLQAHDVVKSNRFVGDHSGMIRTKKRGGTKE